MSKSATTRVETDVVARLDAVERSFGDLTVVEDLALEVPANAVTTVVGPNGSGKTTLLRLVAGVLPPDAGSRSVTADAERPIGYLPQNPQFRPSFTVEETLRFYAGFLSDETDVTAAMERVGLVGVSDRRVDALSGGMRRLLGMAVSLLGDPPLVVLDEPTSGLDPRMQRLILDAVADVAASGTAVLAATHDLSWASETDRVVVLDRGRVVAEGRPDELLTDTGTDSLEAAFLRTVGEDTEVQTGWRELSERSKTAGGDEP